MPVKRDMAFGGRAGEREILDRLLERVRAGQSSPLVVRGESGVGKTALMRYAARQAIGFRTALIAGVESEMELPYAGLHQLCAPMLGEIDALPEPQRLALKVAFGLSSGVAPDRFLVALATLSLLAHVAETRPLLCLIDDAQWLDVASGQVLGFVARRLLADSVAIIFAVREPNDDRQLVGLPDLVVGGLLDEDARTLLATVIPGRLDERVRDRIVAETRGNPLALLELPRGMRAAELAGGFALPKTSDLPGEIEEHYLRRVGSLPESTQRLMLLAAADPVGDATIVWRAAETLAIERGAETPAVRDQLLEIGDRVWFHHPLVRSAIYRSSSAVDRRTAHSALAAATDPAADPDRRAWHRAHATWGHDDEVAMELEQSAGRAQARGGTIAAAAFLERSANLTTDRTRRVERMLVAAQLNVQAGAFDEALGLLAAASSVAAGEFANARVDLLRGRVASASRAGREAPGQLLKAAKRLEPLDVALARETYLDAWGAALFAGELASTGDLVEVSRAAIVAPRPPERPGPADLLLDGLALLITEGRAAAAPTLTRAVGAFRGDEFALEKGLQWGVMVSTAAVTLWDFESWDAVITRQAELARATGALALLSIALNGQGIVVTWRGDFDTAASRTAEAAAVTEATGTRIAPYGAMLLAALRGRETELSALIAATVNDATAGGEGMALQYAQWTNAILYNGLGRYEDALVTAQQASDGTPELFLSAWALPEVVEAAVRSGHAELAADALRRLVEANVGDSDWGKGLEARSRALMSEGAATEGWYREAIDRLGRTRLRPELARAHLLFGEWLRRENRRLEARAQLRLAHDLFDAIGADGFAERARRELLATGEKVRKRREDTRHELTSQEEAIARLARAGRTNPEIGAELYISPRTVEWHLSKIFMKLGISSRRELQNALPSRDENPAPA